MSQLETKLGRKVGPLRMYQWIGVGVIIGLGVLVYRRTHEAAPGSPEGEVFGGTGTGAFGPIDPETGIPTAFEGGGGAGSGAGGLSEFFEALERFKDLTAPAETPPTEAPPVTAEPTPAAPLGKPKTKAGAEKKAKKNQAKKTPATSTGAATSAGGNLHATPTHPGQRQGVSHGTAVFTPHTGLGGGHVAGSTATHSAPGVAVVHPAQGTTVGGSGGATGGVVHAAAVSSGIGVGHAKPNPPAGYHTYKGDNGQWWFAPN